MAESLQRQLRGSRGSAVATELLTNAAIFPAANILLELLLDRSGSYWAESDPYTLLLAALAQALAVGRWEHVRRPRPLLGNLIGPALYSLVEVVGEGVAILAHPNHVAYWLFSLAIGALRALRLRLPRLAGAAVVLEGMVRGCILLAMVWIFDRAADAAAGQPVAFLDAPEHRFLALTIPLLGLLYGFADHTAQRYLWDLRAVAERLGVYSEWLLGSHLLARAVAEPEALTLRRRERALLFMDIRGFTRWSEGASPEQVVGLVNAYFDLAEEAWRQGRPIKAKLTGDEIMAVFATAAEAAAAALAMRAATAPLLSGHGLGAGIGLHWGAVVEGLLGSRGTKSYDLLGDTVNTAKRICDAAAAGEILVSPAFGHALGPGSMLPGSGRKVALKGKAEEMTLFPLAVE